MDGEPERNKMVYSNKFVASIRVNSGSKKGQILREMKDGIVRLPFGCEYSIFMKNLSSQRAVVKITIDGNDVGGTIVIDANSTANLERKIGRTKGCKFKFIEKTAEISEHRGDRIDDGIVRLEYQYEAPRVRIRKSIIEEHHHHHHDLYPQPTIWYGDGFVDGSTTNMCCGFSNADSVRACSMDTNNCGLGNSQLATLNENQDGITVDGSDSHQGFYDVRMGELESEKYVIVLKLVGTNETDCGRVVEAVTVNMMCPNCGNRGRGCYCAGCGTRLRY